MTDSQRAAVPVHTTCFCPQVVRLLDSADRLMRASARGVDIRPMAKKWLEEREKLCPGCPSKEE